MTYYSILDLDENCNKNEIRLSYIKLAIKYHPDNDRGINIDKFKLINEAYEILINDCKREVYDNSDKNIMHMNYMNPFDIYNNFFNKTNEDIIKTYIGHNIYDDYFFKDDVKNSYIFKNIK